MDSLLDSRKKIKIIFHYDMKSTTYVTKYPQNRKLWEDYLEFNGDKFVIVANRKDYEYMQVLEAKLTTNELYGAETLKKLSIEDLEYVTMDAHEYGCQCGASNVNSTKHSKYCIMNREW